MKKVMEKFGGTKFLIVAGIIVIAIIIAAFVFSGMDISGGHGHSHD